MTIFSSDIRVTQWNKLDKVRQVLVAVRLEQRVEIALTLRMSRRIQLDTIDLKVLRLWHTRMQWAMARTSNK